MAKTNEGVSSIMKGVKNTAESGKKRAKKVEDNLKGGVKVEYVG
jgi:hypothetical protein